MSQITKEAVLCTFGAFSDETKEDTEKLVYFNQNFGEEKTFTLDPSKVTKPKKTRYKDYKGNPIGTYHDRGVIMRKHILVLDKKELKEHQGNS